MAEENRLEKVLREAITPADPDYYQTATSISREAVQKALEQQYPSSSYEHPPVHPRDYEMARVALGLPKDHWLTIDEFYEGLTKARKEGKRG